MFERAHLRALAVSGTGLAVALSLTVPIRMPSAAQCPASHEGLIYCQLQKGWGRAITQIVFILLAFHVVNTLPARVHEWRDEAAPPSIAGTHARGAGRDRTLTGDWSGIPGARPLPAHDG